MAAPRHFVVVNFRRSIFGAYSELFAVPAETPADARRWMINYLWRIRFYLRAEGVIRSHVIIPSAEELWRWAEARRNRG